MKGKHHKHPPLTKAQKNTYHLSEWAIYGTSCDKIYTFYSQICKELPHRSFSYIDADHSEMEKGMTLQVGKKQFHYPLNESWNEYCDKLQNEALDAAFVNGNHYPSTRQIVILDPQKKESLQRRAHQLDNIDLVLTTDAQPKPYEFLESKISKQTRKIHIGETSCIVEYLDSKIKEAEPPIAALILAGGKSTRMQEDKSLLRYHNGLTEVERLGHICTNFGLEVFVSKAHNWDDDTFAGYPIIKDRLIDLGPFGAIASAFLHNPNQAYLVLACDLPLLTSETIQELIAQRDSSEFATSFQLDNNPFPEPLISIYEPKIYSRMMQFLSLGYACPRKVLINSSIKKILLQQSKQAFNANTPEDRSNALSFLKGIN